MPMPRNEGANYFASMTDLLVGVLFVLIIMVAYLAFQINTEERVPRSIFEQVKKERDTLVSEVQALNAEVAALRKEIERLKEEIRKAKQVNPLEKYMAQGQAKRDQIVQETVEELKALNIDARIGRANNVITISGANLFASGRSNLDSLAGAPERVNKLAEVLRDRIGCHALSEGVSIDELKACNPDFLFVEAVFIEGHTDNVRVIKRLRDGSRNNLELSARRATNTYEQLVTHVPDLKSFKNPTGEQALSVAAYGEQRPMVPNIEPEDREMNRRIDIRFDMHVPRTQQALTKFLEEFK
jgi:chemotaxis protein MotB